jgi:phosphoglycerate dehydrogenase-like enzyme
MTGTPLRILLSAATWRDHGARIAATVPVEPVIFEGGQPPEGCATAEIAFLTRDLFNGGTRDQLSAAFMGFVECMRAAPKLRWLHIFAAGADLWVYQEVAQRGVRLTTSAGATAPMVAQSALAGMLSLSRQMPRCAEAQRRHSWEPIYGAGEPRSLDGQTAVIVGTGPIGQELGRLCGALGLGSIGVRRSAGQEPPPGFDAIVAYDAIAEVLPRADWLILACPLTETTRGLIDAQALSRLPPGAHLINVARGPVVVEEELLAALRSGALAGAMLDVFAQEPLPADSPFGYLPNVIVTPHSAAASDGAAATVARIFARNLSRWHTGQPLLNEVARAG